SPAPESAAYCPPPPQPHALALHDALPIYPQVRRGQRRRAAAAPRCGVRRAHALQEADRARDAGRRDDLGGARHEARARALGHLRSEEHTSELQSRENLVCRLLLEKKKK